MRAARLITAVCILALSGSGVASAQVTEPFKVLEEARRDRLNLERRLAAQAAAGREKEKADRAARANAERTLQMQRLEQEANASAGASALNQVGNLPSGGATRGTPDGLPPSGAVTDGSSASSQPPSSAEAHAASARSTHATDLAEISTSGPPLRAQAPEVVPQAPMPNAVETSAAVAAPVSNPPGAPASRDVPGGTPVQPATRVLITVDKAAQRMRVTVDGKLRHSWPVSTGRAEFETPAGNFRPLRLAKEHYSREWDDAPMPHSIFFTDRGHAIHGSNATRQLGRRASHGCVRLAPSKAATLFKLVQSEGPSATKVTVTGGNLGKTAQNAARARRSEAVARNSGQLRRSSHSADWTGNAWIE